MSKEYEIKTKMEQEQLLQLKMLFLLGYWVITWKLLFRAGGMTFGGEGVGGGGGRGREWAIFQLVWWDFSPSSSKENPAITQLFFLLLTTHKFPFVIDTLIYKPLIWLPIIDKTISKLLYNSLWKIAVAYF